MTVELFEKIVASVSDVILILGFLSPLLVQLIKFAKANTANKRVQLLQEYALRVVTAVEQQSNLMPSDKKAVASKKLADYIRKSPLNLNVTDEQISDLVESAVNKLSDHTTAGAKKESTATVAASSDSLELAEEQAGDWMSLKKGMYFLDISGYQPADMRAMTAAAGTDKTIIKLTESTSYYNSYAISQTNTSDCIGYYHFARFGGSVAQAQAEAAYFLSTVPKKVKYLVCDYEDSASGNKQANTNAVIAFMDAIKAAGYEPIYYSYRPFTVANIYHDQLNAKYPNSTWIAAYPNYAVTPDPVWSIFPSIDGARWWQFTSTAIAGGLDKNVVLLDDSQTQAEEIIEGALNNMDYTIAAKSGKLPYVVLTQGAAVPVAHLSTVSAFQKAGAKDVKVEDDDYQRIIAAINKKQDGDFIKKLKKLILLSATVLSLATSAVYAHTANITVHQANELYTRLAAENRGVNYDNVYGFQCVDIPGDLMLNYVGKPIYGNAIDLLDSARAVGYEIVPADRSPRVGDIFVMDAWPLYGHGYGHTGYIWQVNPDGSFETVEQNVGDDANLYYGTPARLVHRTRDYMLGYIRLAYQK